MDSAGNPYITGTFSGTIDFGSGPLTSGEFPSAFVAKLRPRNGVAIWSDSSSGGGSCTNAIAFDDSTGQAYIAGTYTPPVKFGSTTLSSKGNLSVFVASLD